MSRFRSLELVDSRSCWSEWRSWSVDLQQTVQSPIFSGPLACLSSFSSCNSWAPLVLFILLTPLYSRNCAYRWCNILVIFVTSGDNFVNCTHILECIMHHVHPYSDSCLYWCLAYIREGIFDLHIYVAVTSPYPWDWGVTVYIDDMLVKSLECSNHMKNFWEAFAFLRKCETQSQEVYIQSSFGKFLG